MLKTVHAVLKQDGTYRLAEPVEIHGDQPVLVTLLEDRAEEDAVNGVPVTMLLSELALADWDRPEEDEAWEHLQPAKS